MPVQREPGEQALISGSQHYGGSTWTSAFISVFTPLCKFLCKKVLELIYMANKTIVQVRKKASAARSEMHSAVYVIIIHQRVRLNYQEE